MEKNIWVLDNNKSELVNEQHIINKDGALRAISMLSHEAVLKAVKRDKEEGEPIRPSLIILDYETEKNEDFKTLITLQGHSNYAGVPVIFMVKLRTDIIDEECYEKGATVVVTKPFNNAAILRIERMAWQYEKSRNYEKILQKQAAEISTARQIRTLNEQLANRNELLHQIFGRYFSNEVVEVILDNPEGSSIGGDKKTVTVMMADLRGFTSVSEELEADVVTDMINFFLGKMTEVIFKFRGSVIEFMGDAILAVFGAPVELDNSIENAIVAAIHMQNAMKEVNTYNSEKNYPLIEMGIGINKGEVFIGNIGSNRMMRYNVMGNTVNLTSRIESYSVGGQVLVAKESLTGLENKVKVKKEFIITAKGISKKVSVCEVTEVYDVDNCMLDDDEDEMIQIGNDLKINLFIMQDKEILDKKYIGRLKAVSKKRAVVHMENAEDIELFSDVELRANDKESSAVFANSYAKVTAREDNMLIMHFTYRESVKI